MGLGGEIEGLEKDWWLMTKPSPKRLFPLGNCSTRFRVRKKRERLYIAHAPLLPLFSHDRQNRKHQI